jgi:hypothetical protein
VTAHQAPRHFILGMLDQLAPAPRPTVAERMAAMAREVGLDVDTVMDMTFAQFAYAVGARRALRESHKIAVAVQARRAVRA